MPSDVELREVLDGDLAAIHAINEAAVPAVGTVSVDQLVRIVDQSMIALVAVDEQQTVGGFCLVLPPDTDYGSMNYAWFRDRFDDFIYLDRVAITPEFQRRGLGQRMYAEVERLAADRRPTATEFTLEVNLIPRNDQSLAFHDRLGFRQIGVRTPSPDYSVSMMSRPLHHGRETGAESGGGSW